MLMLSGLVPIHLKILKTCALPVIINAAIIKAQTCEALWRSG